MSDIKQFLTDLSSNPSMGKDLASCLPKYNLSDEEKATLTSGDPEAIQSLVKTHIASSDDPNVVVVVVILVI